VTELHGEDIEAIEKLHDRWIDAERSGDFQATLELCTNDVVWLPPNSAPLLGKEAIRQWLGTAQPEIKNLDLRGLRIRGSGSVAYKLCDYSTTYVAPGSFEVRRGEGTHLWVLHRWEDASWKVAVVSWSFSVNR
jgi:uncharacterized protein (TIGR02246 family)